MVSYVGCQCKLCQRQFVEGDDVVVCPDCGTPYHRSCYASSGHCVNGELHASGGSWQATMEEHARKMGGIECPRCRTINPPNTSICYTCRHELSEQETDTAKTQARIGAIRMGDNATFQHGEGMMFDMADPLLGLSPNEDMGGVRLKELASYVGSNTVFYIPNFLRFRKTGKKLSVNLTCMLFPQLYFAYRKMWSYAILAIFLTAILNLPSVLVSLLSYLSYEGMSEMIQESYGQNAASMIDSIVEVLGNASAMLESMGTYCTYLLILVKIIVGLFANYLYFLHAKRHVRNICCKTSSESMAAAILSSEGGGSWIAVFIAMLLGYMVSVGLVAVAVFVAIR